MTLVLITGPARSGKSEWAERLAACSAKKDRQVVYVATAVTNADDAEWCARIVQHRARRPEDWGCEEVPIALAAAIAQYNKSHCLLIDSLGTWLANLIEQSPQEWECAQRSLIIALERTAADVILVSEETGWGVVPAYPIGRTFRDRLGTLNRRIGCIADHVYLVTNGYALDLKKIGQPIS